jgi:hypothetical protein
MPNAATDGNREVETVVNGKIVQMNQEMIIPTYIPLKGDRDNFVPALGPLVFFKVQQVHLIQRAEPVGRLGV